MQPDRRLYILGRDTLPGLIRLGAGEQLEMILLAPEGVSADVQMVIELTGENARLDLAGAYVCRADERLSLDIHVRHLVPRCQSAQLFKGVVGGRAKAAFKGLVYVAKDAQQTEARQENHSLLLSDEAFVQSQPQLEIYADDVICSHGATSGHLDEDAIFYLRSRGVEEAQARAMLTEAFLAPIYARMADNRE